MFRWGEKFLRIALHSWNRFVNIFLCRRARLVPWPKRLVTSPLNWKWYHYCFQSEKEQRAKIDANLGLIAIIKQPGLLNARNNLFLFNPTDSWTAGELLKFCSCWLDTMKQGWLWDGVIRLVDYTIRILWHAFIMSDNWQIDKLPAQPSNVNPNQSIITDLIKPRQGNKMIEPTNRINLFQSNFVFTLSNSNSQLTRERKILVHNRWLLQIKICWQRPIRLHVKCAFESRLR